MDLLHNSRTRRKQNPKEKGDCQSSVNVQLANALAWAVTSSLNLFCSLCPTCQGGLSSWAKLCLLQAWICHFSSADHALIPSLARAVSWFSWEHDEHCPQANWPVHHKDIKETAWFEKKKKWWMKMKRRTKLHKTRRHSKPHELVTLQDGVSVVLFINCKPFLNWQLFFCVHWPFWNETTNLIQCFECQMQRFLIVNLIKKEMSLLHDRTLLLVGAFLPNGSHCGLFLWVNCFADLLHKSPTFVNEFRKSQEPILKLACLAQPSMVCAWCVETSKTCRRSEECSKTKRRKWLCALDPYKALCGALWTHSVSMALGIHSLRTQEESLTQTFFNESFSLHLSMAFRKLPFQSTAELTMFIPPPFACQLPA